MASPSGTLLIPEKVPKATAITVKITPFRSTFPFAVPACGNTVVCKIDSGERYFECPAERFIVIRAAGELARRRLGHLDDTFVFLPIDQYIDREVSVETGGCQCLRCEPA